jgi:hypothetical protein
MNHIIQKKNQKNQTNNTGELMMLRYFIVKVGRDKTSAGRTQAGPRNIPNLFTSQAVRSARCNLRAPSLTRWEGVV